MKFTCNFDHELGSAQEDVPFSCTVCGVQIPPQEHFGRCGECRFYMCSQCAMANAFGQRPGQKRRINEEGQASVPAAGVSSLGGGQQVIEESRLEAILDRC
eukprot:11682068-Karenia_brevis.AAC.1